VDTKVSFCNNQKQIADFHCIVTKLEKQHYILPLFDMKVNDVLHPAATKQLVKVNHLDKIEFISAVNDATLPTFPHVYHLVLPGDPSKVTVSCPSSSMLNSKVYQPLVKPNMQGKIYKKYLEMIEPF